MNDNLSLFKTEALERLMRNGFTGELKVIWINGEVIETDLRVIHKSPRVN